MSEFDRQTTTVLTPAATKLRLCKPEDLVVAVPYLLGFHPRSSVVLVGFVDAAGSPGQPRRGLNRHRLTVTARLDLADCDPVFFDTADGRNTAADSARHIANTIARSGATSVAGLVFAGTGDTPESIVRAIRCIGQACEDAGLQLGDWLVGSDDPSAAPVSAVAAQAAFAGLIARPDRSSLVASLAPLPATERARLRPDLLRAERFREQTARDGRLATYRMSAIRALHAASRAGTVVRDAEVVRFGAALRDDAVRDGCWLPMEHGTVDGEQLWRDLGRRLPDPWRASVLFLFAWSRWRRGDGASAAIAVRCALESDPAYRAAILLEEALRGGVDPFALPRLQSRSA